MIEFRDWEEAIDTRKIKTQLSVNWANLVCFLENRHDVRALEGLLQCQTSRHSVVAIILDGPAVVLGRGILLDKNEPWGKIWTIVLDGKEAQDLVAFIDPSLYARLSRGKSLF